MYEIKMHQSARTIFSQSTYGVLPHARLQSQVRVHTQFQSQESGMWKDPSRILPHRELNSYGHMLGSYQVESYRVLQSTHRVTLLLNLPVSFKNDMRAVTIDSYRSMDHQQDIQDKSVSDLGKRTEVSFLIFCYMVGEKMYPLGKILGVYCPPLPKRKEKSIVQMEGKIHREGNEGRELKWEGDWKEDERKGKGEPYTGGREGILGKGKGPWGRERF